MKNNAVKTALCACLSVVLLAGCSYFPATMPTFFPTGSNNPTAVTGTAPSAQTAPSETTAQDPSKAAEAAFEDFISGKIKVSTAGCFEKEGGKSYLDLTYGLYSFDELKKAVRFDAASGSKARYSILNCGDDNVPELAVCLEMLDKGESSVICLIGYEGGELIMNALIEEKVPNEYRLFDSGYMESGMIPSKGIFKKVLIKVEAGGKCSEVFTCIDYTGNAAAAIIKHLSKSEEVTTEGFEALPENFLVREFISDGQIVVSVSNWSEAGEQRDLEEKFIAKLKSLGAEEVSETKMQELISTRDYTLKETIWKDCDANASDPTTVGIANAAGNFSITVYQDPESSEYTGLGNVVHVLCSGNGTDMRLVCDSDDVTLILEKGAWDMNTDAFAPEIEIFNVNAKSGTVYQFNCVAGDVFPYYRLRAVKGSFNAEWLVLKSKTGSVTVIKSSMSGEA